MDAAKSCGAEAKDRSTRLYANTRLKRNFCTSHLEFFPARHDFRGVWPQVGARQQSSPLRRIGAPPHSISRSVFVGGICVSFIVSGLVVYGLVQTPEDFSAGNLGGAASISSWNLLEIFTTIRFDLGGLRRRAATGHHTMSKNFRLAGQKPRLAPTVLPRLQLFTHGVLASAVVVLAIVATVQHHRLSKAESKACAGYGDTSEGASQHGAWAHPPSAERNGSRGVIYITLGEPAYVKQACISAWSIANSTNATQKAARVSIVTDADGVEVARQCMRKTGVALFEHIIDIDVATKDLPLKSSWGGRAAKIRGLQLSPYDHTIYLDTDTIVCGLLDELYGVLEFADLAAAHNPGSAPTRENEVELPMAFHPINTGVLLYRKSDVALRFFARWEKNYLSIHRPAQDQGAFRQTLLELRHDIRFYTLHRAWNCRTHDTWKCPLSFIRRGYFKEEQCKILHNQYVMEKRFKLSAGLLLPPN
jgi:hypothetical protein